mmetsp:Transcript_2192/g.2401  ORF Transcript_2192/g.2401 Transcript_2192/m.2401 type:complete len:292 (-) Transcript_2192:934-1809(-)
MDLFVGRPKSQNFHKYIPEAMKRNTEDHHFEQEPNEPNSDSELKMEDSDNFTTSYFAGAPVGNFFPTYLLPNMSQVPPNNYIQQQAYLSSQTPHDIMLNSPTMNYLTGNRPNTTTYQQNQVRPQRDYSLPDMVPLYPQEEAQKPIVEPSITNPQRYPDMTTLINSNTSIKVPLVESAFVDHKTCSVCGKKISRDMLRHMRTHQTVARFRCNFPKIRCNHKSRRFNRPYDHKKHLLNRHFKFDVPAVKKLHNLNDKLGHSGTCPCGQRFIAKEWLEKHILTNDLDHKCPLVE